MQPERWAVTDVLHITSTSCGAGVLTPACLPACLVPGPANALAG